MLCVCLKKCIFAFGVVAHLPAPRVCVCVWFEIGVLGDRASLEHAQWGRIGRFVGGRHVWRRIGYVVVVVA